MAASPSLIEPTILRALAGAANLRSGVDDLLGSIVETVGWRYGAIWLLDETGELGLAGDCASDPAFAAFAAASESRAFTPGQGLIGRVLAEAAPAWLSDIRTDPSFLRGEAARQTGLATAVGVPIMGGTGPVGALELLTDEVLEPDAQLIAALESVGTHAGLAIEAWWAGERERRSDASRAAVVASALDCIVIMDARGRVVEFNAAAEETFGYPREEAIGRELGELIIPPEHRDSHRRGLLHYLATGESKILGKRLELEAVRRDGTRLPVELSVTALGQQPTRFAGFVRDLTPLHEAADEHRRLAEREREARLNAEAAEARYRELSATLQTSLLPPRLPDVTGHDVAAHFQSGAEGLSVGGDFYDVFETRTGWHCVIGDVCGKGAHAAAIAALSRYTMRAASMRFGRPSEVLATLNEALCSEDGRDPNLCTAICVDLSACRLSIGGHPLPLIRRESGLVEVVGRPGALLGGWESPTLDDHDFTLETGDTLLLYTDGLSEARRGDEMLGDETLATVLGRLRPSSPQDLIDQLLAAVFEEHGYTAGDDVALLAISPS